MNPGEEMSSVTKTQEWDSWRQRWLLEHCVLRTALRSKGDEARDGYRFAPTQGRPSLVLDVGQLSAQIEDGQDPATSPKQADRHYSPGGMSVVVEDGGQQELIDSEMGKKLIPPALSAAS